MKQLFQELNIKSDLSFKSLFKPAISKKILLHYLDEIESKRPPLLDYKAMDDKALFAHLLFYNPELSIKKLLQVYGLSKVLEIYTMRELKSMAKTTWHNQGKPRRHEEWYGIMADAKEIKLSGTQQNSFGSIREYIKRFKALK